MIGVPTEFSTIAPGGYCSRPIMSPAPRRSDRLVRRRNSSTVNVGPRPVYLGGALPQLIGTLQLGPGDTKNNLRGILEGAVLFAILAFMFWKTRARYEPGKLVGAFILFYGLFRFAIEYIREPDSQLVEFAQSTGLHMGQWLSVPMILGGLYLMLTARGRRERVESFAGTESVA